MIAAPREPASGSDARAHGGMNGSPMARGVRVLSSEEERVFDRPDQIQHGLKAAGWHVAIRATTMAVCLPVVRRATNQLRLQIPGRQRKDSGELFAGSSTDFFRCHEVESCRLRSTDPSRQGVGFNGMVGPPDRRHGIVCKQETELGQVDRLALNPEALTKEKGETAGRAHAEIGSLFLMVPAWVEM